MLPITNNIVSNYNNFGLQNNISSEQEIIEAIQKDYTTFIGLPPENKTRNICLEAVRLCGTLLEYVPENLRDNEICLKAVQQNYLAFSNVPQNLSKYKEIAIEAIKQSKGWIKPSCIDHPFELIPTDHKDYTEIAMVAVRCNLLNLDLVPTNRENYKMIFIEALKQHWELFQTIPINHPDYTEFAVIFLLAHHCFDRIPKNKYDDIVTAAILRDPSILFNILDNEERKKFILAAIPQNNQIFGFMIRNSECSDPAHYCLRDSAGYMIADTTHHCTFDFSFCKQIILESLPFLDDNILKYLPLAFQYDREICLAIVQRNSLALENIPLDHPNYNEIVTAAIKQNIVSAKFIPNYLWASFKNLF